MWAGDGRRREVFRLTCAAQMRRRTTTVWSCGRGLCGTRQRLNMHVCAEVDQPVPVRAHGEEPPAAVAPHQSSISVTWSPSALKLIPGRSHHPVLFTQMVNRPVLLVEVTARRG